jgi:hypothetical protein
LSCDFDATNCLSGDNATVLPSSELLGLFGTSCSVIADSFVDDGFAKMSDLRVCSAVPPFVDSCLAVDSESEVTNGLRVTVKELETDDNLVSNAEIFCCEDSG